MSLKSRNQPPITDQDQAGARGQEQMGSRHGAVGKTQNLTAAAHDGVEQRAGSEQAATQNTKNTRRHEKHTNDAHDDPNPQKRERRAFLAITPHSTTTSLPHSLAVSSSESHADSVVAPRC